MEQITRRAPTLKSENTAASNRADRAAIERWEGEGGRALVLEQSFSVHPRESARALGSGL
jgi:hypothetical protein